MNKLVIGLPKGSLQESTFALFKKAGFTIKGGSRSYFPSIDDDEIEIRILRAQEMSRYVEHGMLDAGIAGLDWIEANGSDVVSLCDLVYSKQSKRPVRWVLAVPNDSPIQSVKDLEGKRIATEGVGIVERWLERNGVKAEVEFSWGATEVKVPDFVDAIVDITETGSSLKANNLRVVDTTTSEIVHARTVEGRASKGGISLGIFKSGFGGRLKNEEKTPTGKAIRAGLVEATDYLVCAMVTKTQRCLAEFDAKEEKRRDSLKDTLNLDGP